MRGVAGERDRTMQRAMGAVAQPLSCYTVVAPASIAGRRVQLPADSASRALWESAGVRADRLILTGDTLRSAMTDTTRAIALRARCP